MRRSWEPAWVYSEAVRMVFVCAFPLIRMLSASLNPSFVPHRPTLRNFYRLFSDTNFLMYFKTA